MDSDGDGLTNGEEMGTLIDGSIALIKIQDTRGSAHIDCNSARLQSINPSTDLSKQEIHAASGLVVVLLEPRISHIQVNVVHATMLPSVVKPLLHPASNPTTTTTTQRHPTTTTTTTIPMTR